MLLNKPEYLYNPQKILTRLYYPFLKNKGISKIVKLNPRISIKVNIDEVIGRSIYTSGVYDLAVSEFIQRVVLPGDTCVDVGANIGYTSLLMLDKIGKDGQLFCFEPNVEINQKLVENLQTVNRFSAKISISNCALSESKGSSFLSVPEFFGGNNGISFLKSEGGDGTYEVPTDTLDNTVPKTAIKLLKMDVEGHELGVLKGADTLLSSGLIEYILFEDQPPFPSPVFQILTNYGYKIWKLAKTVKGLKLVTPEDTSYDLSYEPFNFVALKDASLLNQINMNPKWLTYAKDKKK